MARILIAGSGETGSHLAEMLSVENQDVILMDTDAGHLQQLESEFNFQTYAGSPWSYSALSECGAAKANLFVAVTTSDTANMMACGLARQLGAAKCVARVSDPEYSSSSAADLLPRLGIDMVICPELAAAEACAHFIRHNWVTDWLMFRHGELIVTGVRIGPGSLVAGKSLREVSPPPRFFHVAMIKRGERVIIPRGDDTIQPADTLYIATLPPEVGRVRQLCGAASVRPRRVMITGGGRVTENLLALLGAGISVTVIEPDLQRCREMSLRFPEAVIVNARSNDVTAMKEEGIGKCDIFLALTGSSEANIVACMVARESGVVKTVARIEEFQYVQEAESLAIDKVINKKQLNAGMVMNLLLDSEVATTQFLASDKAEVSVLEASAGSDITTAPVGSLSLPSGITIAGLIRNGSGQLVGGDTVIHPGDQVVVFFLTGSLAKVKRLFR